MPTNPDPAAVRCKHCDRTWEEHPTGRCPIVLTWEPSTPAALRCSIHGYVMVQEFDEKPITKLASLAIPNGRYYCVRCRNEGRPDPAPAAVPANWRCRCGQTYPDNRLICELCGCTKWWDPRERETTAPAAAPASPPKLVRYRNVSWMHGEDGDQWGSTTEWYRADHVDAALCAALEAGRPPVEQEKP